MMIGHQLTGHNEAETERRQRREKGIEDVNTEAAINECKGRQIGLDVSVLRGVQVRCFIKTRGYHLFNVKTLSISWRVSVQHKRHSVRVKKRVIESVH